MHVLLYDEKWDLYFQDLSPDIQARPLKKLDRIREGLPGRHLRHGLPFFVEEVGQYRICYTQDEASRTRKIYFAGDHKQYGRWLREKQVE